MKVGKDQQTTLVIGRRSHGVTLNVFGLLRNEAKCSG